MTYSAHISILTWQSFVKHTRLYIIAEKIKKKWQSVVTYGAHQGPDGHTSLITGDGESSLDCRLFARLRQHDTYTCICICICHHWIADYSLAYTISSLLYIHLSMLAGATFSDLLDIIHSTYPTVSGITKIFDGKYNLLDTAMIKVQSNLGFLSNFFSLISQLAKTVIGSQRVLSTVHGEPKVFRECERKLLNSFYGTQGTENN